MRIPLREYFALLQRYLRPQGRKVGALAALLAAATGLQLIIPQILRAFIDGATSGAELETLVRTAVIFIIAGVLHQGVSAGSRYLGEDVGWGATNLLRNDLAAHCIRLDMSFHKAHTPGELIERIDGDVSTMANFFSQFVLGMIGSLLLLVGILAALFLEDWRAGLGLSLFALLALYSLGTVRRIAVPFWEAVRGYSARFFGFLGEHLAGTEDIQANGGAGHVIRRLHLLLREWYPLARKAELAGYSMWVASTAVFAAGNALAFALGYWLWRSEAVTIGTVYLIYHYTLLLRRPIERIRTQLQDMQRASASINRVQRLLDTRSAIVDGPGRPIPAGPLPLVLESVGFGYEPDEQVLHDIQLSLQPGRVLGLLGRTGSGKTTLARLLVRMYDPTSGAIRMGGTPLREARLAELRRRVGLVTQDVQLLAGTVRDNLSFFDPGLPDSALLAAIAELGLLAWYESLPQGLDTKLGSGSRGLSAGEAQLLALARLFLNDPGLVIMDEATSRLDPATEGMIERAVDRLLRDRTAIIIAHRLGTVDRADEIMILEAGRTLEHGDRAALARDPGSRFHRLLRTGLEDVLA
ncbi:MAG: ABC transporter ATP-binding protein [Bacillota bacterium]|nr:ABC transporter ATP-binding protein [Bacillota bacterium]